LYDGLGIGLVCGVQSMCRCLDSIKCQVCQLTKSNECAKRQRDELCHCNQSTKCRVREMEKEVNRVNSIIDCLREKVLVRNNRRQPWRDGECIPPKNIYGGGMAILPSPNTDG